MENGELEVFEEEDGSFTLHGVTDGLREVMLEKGFNYILLMELFKVDESEVFDAVKQYVEKRNGIET